MPEQSPLRICFVSLHYGQDISGSDVDAYLTRVPIHRALPRAMAGRGHQVELVHLYPTAADFVEDGVRYRFVPPGPEGRVIGGGVRRWTHRDPAVYQPALRAIRLIRDSRPDVIHFHGLTLNWNLFLLLLALGARRPPIVAQYHGGYPPINLLARQVQRFNLRRVARLLFTTRAHAEPFLDAGVLDDATRIVPFMETSSTFRFRDRRAARQRTGMEGDPVFLWAGRLHPIKDPHTALRGFERIAEACPGARLYLYYLTDDLLPELRAYLASRPDLAARVHCRGRATFEQMEDIYNSADFLLQASRREFSGCAILEALACGVIPVVSDIPSFRAMTDDGRQGVLFPVGDAAVLARGVLGIDRSTIPARAAETRAWFERALSFDALAEKLDDVYGDLGLSDALVEIIGRQDRRDSQASRHPKSS
jgi:glycosyltransferase involved in cell wall biosynthesis